MSKPSFVYVTYINSTPQRVWDALLDGEMTKLYWGQQRNVSDWKPGSKWEHQHYDDPSAVNGYSWTMTIRALPWLMAW